MSASFFDNERQKYEKQSFPTAFCEFYYIFALFTHGIYTLTEQRNEKTDLLSCVDVPADWSSCCAG
jgi:hypothetical protein